MKVNIIFPLLLFLLNASPLSGQLGIKAGAGLSDIAFLEYGQSPYLGYEVNTLEHRVPRLSIQAGVFGTFKLTKRFDYQLELLYVLQGIDYRTEFIYDDLFYRINIHYIQVPLLLKYKISRKASRDSGLLLGPYTAFKLKAIKHTEFEGQKESNKVPNVRDLDFGIIAGYSLDFNIPSGQLVIDFRANYSLINMMDRIEGYIPWYYGPEKAYARNINLSLSFGYRFSTISLTKAKQP